MIKISKNKNSTCKSKRSEHSWTPYHEQGFATGSLLVVMVLGSDYIHLKQNCFCQTCFFASQVTYHFHFIFTANFHGTAFFSSRNSKARPHPPRRRIRTARPKPSDRRRSAARRGTACHSYAVSTKRGFHRSIHFLFQNFQDILGWQSESNCFFTPNYIIH